MILTAPSIWRPQSLIEWFTEGKAQRDPTSGKIKRKSANGKAVRNSATNSTCCCSPPATPCPDCVTTPRTITAVISGVSICACAFDFGFGANVSAIGDPNGTFTLEQFDVINFPCCYRYIYDSGVFSFGVYDIPDVTCTTPLGTGDAYLGVCLTGGTVAVTLRNGTSPFSGIPANSFNGFDGSTPVTDCMDPYSIANTTVNCSSVRHMGYGGSIDLTPNA